jgi:hypothetical protein
VGEARDRGLVRRARARLVTGVQARGARDRQVCEAVASRVPAPWRAVALGAAEPATHTTGRQAAEPFAGGLAARGAAAALRAGLARVLACGHLVANVCRRPARVARPSAAADAALNGTERHAGAGQEKTSTEGADAEELEELASGRLPGQFASCDLRYVHRYCVTPAVIILYSSSCTFSTSNSGIAW